MPSIVLIIYLKNGHTFAFESYTDFGSDAEKIWFNYISKGDGMEKSAIFFTENIAGFSTDR